MTTAERLDGMLRDPHCLDDVLLLGVALSGLLDLDVHENRTLQRAERLVHRSAIQRGWWAKKTIADDARTYRPAAPAWTAVCEAPMIRRDGYCRSDKGHHWFYVINYQTGERTPVSYCSRHRPWADDVQAANRAEAPDWSKPWGGAALPAANHGGVLARHFPELDWPELWRKCHPNWVEHPENEARPEPSFRLLIGDGDDDGSAVRPALSLAPAGRRS